MVQCSVSTVSQVHCELTVSQFLPGSESLLLSYSCCLESFSWWVWRLPLFWLSLSFQGRSKKSTRLASLLAWHRCLRANKNTVCAVEPVESVYVISDSLSPLGPSHRHTPDPCASNVNNPAFPERRGGANVKQWREAVKYREIQQGNSNSNHTNSSRLFFSLSHYTFLKHFQDIYWHKNILTQEHLLAFCRAFNCISHFKIGPPYSTVPQDQNAGPNVAD